MTAREAGQFADELRARGYLGPSPAKAIQTLDITDSAGLLRIKVAS
jgi:hypothetical protein